MVVVFYFIRKRLFLATAIFFHTAAAAAFFIRIEKGNALNFVSAVVQTNSHTRRGSEINKTA